MSAVTKSESISKGGEALSFAKGLAVATIMSLGLVLLFAFCLKWFDLADSFIVPVNLAIKGLCVVVGSIITIKKDTNKGLVKGASFGAIYIALAYVVFSILSGGFSLSIATFLDLVFATTLGGIVGVVKVNKN